MPRVKLASHVQHCPFCGIYIFKDGRSGMCGCSYWLQLTVSKRWEHRMYRNSKLNEHYKDGSKLYGDQVEQKDQGNQENN